MRGILGTLLLATLTLAPLAAGTNTCVTPETCGGLTATTDDDGGTCDQPNERTFQEHVVGVESRDQPVTLVLLAGGGCLSSQSANGDSYAYRILAVRAGAGVQGVHSVEAVAAWWSWEYAIGASQHAECHTMANYAVDGEWTITDAGCPAGAPPTMPALP